MEVVVTKKMLQRYATNKRDIILLKTEIREMESNSNQYVGSSVIMNYSKGYGQPEGISGFERAVYDERKKELKEKETEVAVVEEFIRNIKEVTARIVFQKYYIQGKTFETIADELGYHGNPNYVRLHIRDKYLKSQGIK